MIPERIAISTIFICMGVLLLSACGLPLGPPARNRPVVLTGGFVVYGPDHTLVATGILDSTGDPLHLHARITFEAADCLEGKTVSLTGELSPTLTLRSGVGVGPKVLLHSSTAPIYDAYAIRVIPFNGVLSLTESCADRSGPVEATLAKAAAHE